MPNSVLFIGKYYFENCSSLLSITISNYPTYLEEFCFLNWISSPIWWIKNGWKICRNSFMKCLFYKSVIHVRKIH
jgi:hypothetical protein